MAHSTEAKLGVHSTLEKAKIKLLSIAERPHELEQGLQFYSSLPENTGMAFKFKRSSVLSFWMKNTGVPLDIFFVNDKNEVVAKKTMVPYSLKAVTSDVPCIIAIEAKAGEFKDITVGDKVSIDEINRVAIFHG